MSDDTEPLGLWVQERAMVNLHAQQLSEHFDSVHIFVTSNIPGEDKTRHFQTGRGNWFTRYGQIKHWTVREEESTRIDCRKDNEE